MDTRTKRAKHVGRQLRTRPRPMKRTKSVGRQVRTLPRTNQSLAWAVLYQSLLEVLQKHVQESFR
jgi:hypothetical protein